MTDTLIGNLLKWRAGLRRPTVSGLNCGRRTSPRRVLYSYHVYLIWSGLSFKSEMMKNNILKFVVWYPQKVVCILSLRGRTQSLPSLLNTVTCPSRYPMACLILTSRLSGLKRTHYWVRDDEKSRLFGLKKTFSPAASTLIGNLLKRRAGLRRPTAPGLNCGLRTLKKNENYI